MIFAHLFVALYFVCIVWFSTIGDRPFIASDKWTQKYAHCIVLCYLHTSGLYNINCITLPINLLCFSRVISLILM